MTSAEFRTDMTEAQMASWLVRHQIARQRECETGECAHAGAPGVVWSTVMAARPRPPRWYR